jgi:hypothetical protein
MKHCYSRFLHPRLYLQGDGRIRECAHSFTRFYLLFRTAPSDKFMDDVVHSRSSGEMRTLMQALPAMRTGQSESCSINGLEDKFLDSD